MTKEQEILTRVKALATEVSPDSLSKVLFDPVTGLVAKVYPTRREREQFVQTPEYKEIMLILNAKMDEAGLVETDEPPIPDTELDFTVLEWTDYQNAFNSVIRAGETGEALNVLKLRCDRLNNKLMKAMFAVYLKSRQTLNVALTNPEMSPASRMPLLTAYYRSEGALAALLATLENMAIVLGPRPSQPQTSDTGT